MTKKDPACEAGSETYLDRIKNTPTPAPKQAFPPGLVGEIAQFIFDAAPRPVPEIALAGAIGFLAGITGRAYNVSGTGLNQYVAVVARTGRGKEALASGISKLRAALALSVASIIDFVGPTEIASPQALLKWLASQPCIYSVLGEFGHTLKAMSDPRAPANDAGKLRVFLDLYAKSGHGCVLGAMAYSEREKNTAVINSPSLTLICESTPEKLFENMTEDLISSGLLPRFLFFEYDGPRVAKNETHASATPLPELVGKLAELTAHSLGISSRNLVCNVEQTPAAKAVFDKFDLFCDQKINSQSSTQVSIELWNRAHIKAMKLGALIAVGCNYLNPIIDERMAHGSIEMVRAQVNSLSAKFSNGETGQSEDNELLRRNLVLKTILHYCTTPFEQLPKSYGAIAELHAQKLVPLSYLQKALFNMACFRRAHGGAKNALKSTIENMRDNDELREIPKTQMVAQHNTTARTYEQITPTTPRSFIPSKPAIFFEK